MDLKDFKDIADEQYREYVYDGGSVLRIDNPVKLHVSPSSLGGHAHRVLDAGGVSHYVVSGWLSVRWKVKDGQPHFAF